MRDTLHSIFIIRRQEPNEIVTLRIWRPPPPPPPPTKGKKKPPGGTFLRARVQFQIDHQLVRTHNT